MGFVGFECIPGLLAAEHNLKALWERHSKKRTDRTGPCYEVLLTQVGSPVQHNMKQGIYGSNMLGTAWRCRFTC